MDPATLKPGVVVYYPYLWSWQSGLGETGGRKDRPVCIALPLRRDDVTHLFLLAITRTPKPGCVALEIPETEKRRVGLKDWKTSFVVIDEYNYDIAEQSFCFDQLLPVLGRFSETFTTRINEMLRQALTKRETKRIDRTAE